MFLDAFQAFKTVYLSSLKMNVPIMAV